MLNADELLQHVTKDVVIQIMNDNGSPLYGTTIDRRTNQECLWFQTICHGGDSHKLCYFTDTKDFYCYTNCGRMTFFTFISKILNISQEQFYQAITYVAKYVGISTSTSSNRKGFQMGESVKEAREDEEEADRILEKRRNSNSATIREGTEKGYLYQLNLGQKENQNYYDSNILNFFDKDTFYKGWIDEGISIDTMEKYQIEWYEYQKHIIIPHFDMYGHLVGIRRRSLKPEDVNRKYMPEIISNVEYGHSLGLNLYGLYQNKKAIERKGEAIIVEAEKSVLLSDTYFGEESHTVATCGFSISEWQILSLRQLGVDTIYLGFDKDFDIKRENEYKQDKTVYSNFLRYCEKIKTMAHRLTDNFNVYIITDTQGLLDIKDSPFDKGKDIFEKLYNNARTRKVSLWEI